VDYFMNLPKQAKVALRLTAYTCALGHAFTLAKLSCILH
jgi:hypothetical protein